MYIKLSKTEDIRKIRRAFYKAIKNFRKQGLFSHSKIAIQTVMAIKYRSI